MKLVKKFKANLLTKLFLEWVETEVDVQTLQMTNKMVSDRIDIVDNRTKVIGFKINN